jgi:two-component system chemotaxis response regulator CheY
MRREAKALIVDDSSIALLMTNFMLQKFGMVDISEAGNGLRALEEFEAALMGGTPFSIVFLDIVMPLMGGQETLRRMRALEAERGVASEDRAIIIMATSLHSTNDMMDALIEGDCSDYLVKPFSTEDVKGMLIKFGFLEES